MDAIIKQVIQQDLTGTEIRDFVKDKYPLHMYQDLGRVNNLHDILGPQNACIILFPVQSATSGHYTAIIYYEEINTLHYFDSYGFDWNQELKYSNQPITKQNLIGKLFANAQQQGMKVTFNQNRYQVLKDGVNTCGKHCIMRLKFKYLREDEYGRLMRHQKYTPDEIVTMATFLGLEDNKLEKNIIKRIIR